jgi:hypothetical protein
MDGYQHRQAGTAESVIGIVLFIGLVLTWIRPVSTRGISVAVQAFALLGTLVGIFTLVIGVGPRTAPDILYHVCIVIALVSGLIVAAQRGFMKPGSGPRPDPLRLLLRQRWISSACILANPQLRIAPKLATALALHFT